MLRSTSPLPNTSLMTMNGSSSLPEPVAASSLKLPEASEKVMPGKEISPAAHAAEPIDTE